MITKPTVLILGAGASAHCGYPLGSELVSRLCRLRGSSELDHIPEGWTREVAETFLTRLSRSGHYSIDAFLGKQNTGAPLGKFLITQEMKKHEDINNLFPPHNSGWYQYLFNALIGDDGPQFEKSLLSIVTFNYDRSLEAYLHVALQNRFLLSEADAEQILRQLPIIHVHGTLGDYPQVSYSPQCSPAELVSISSKIQIIYEIQDRDGDFCNEMFQKSHHLLQDAERIYFLGFGFHPENLRRFRFFNKDSTRNKILRCTTWGLITRERAQLLTRLEEAGFTEQSFPLNCTDCWSFFEMTAYLE